MHVYGLDVRHVPAHHVGQSLECQRRCHAKVQCGAVLCVWLWLTLQTAARGAADRALRRVKCVGRGNSCKYHRLFNHRECARDEPLLRLHRVLPAAPASQGSPMPSGHRPLRSILRTSRLSRRSCTRGGTSGGDNHVDLLQLVDAQATACAALIEESHASMRELLQKSSHGGAVNTARFSERLEAQHWHLRVFLEEECSKLQQTIARGQPGRRDCRSWQESDCRSWQETCFGRRSLCLAKGLGPEFGDGKQIWWTRQFRSNYLEYAYRQHHFEVWRPRVRIIAVLTSIGVAYITASSFMEREPPPDALMWDLPPPPARKQVSYPLRPLSRTLPASPTVPDLLPPARPLSSDRDGHARCR